MSTSADLAFPQTRGQRPDNFAEAREFEATLFRVAVADPVVHRVSGLVGYSLRARLAAKRFWTLSVWEDETALRAFVAAPPHAAVMKALAPHMGASRFTHWTVKGYDLPLKWDGALKRGDSAG
jgi:heme-degrading monooxygenase HmoA